MTEAECFLRGTNWIFKLDRYSFVLKGLKEVWEGRVQRYYHWNTLLVLDFIQFREIDHLGDCQLLKNSTSWNYQCNVA